MVVDREDRAEPGGVVKKLAWNADTVKVNAIGQTFSIQKTRVEQHVSGEVVGGRR